VVTRRAFVLGAAALVAGCARGAAGGARAADDSARSTDDSARAAEETSRALDAVVASSRLTVVTFFSAHCPCQAAHDARLRALFDRYAARGVGFVALDSESDATAARDRAEARARMYPFPLLLDRGGAHASALGAVFATHSVVLDPHGRVLYRGGIDSDRTHLSSDTRAYLQDALDDLLEGRPPRVAESEPLGCALMLH
jgi:hypothetical protein